MTEKGVILSQGWFRSGRFIDENWTCPKCGNETQVYIENDGKHEYITKERCVQGCFTNNLAGPIKT
ncbi:MAG TPA: hypothetical protein VMW28_02930 [Pelolinea sp.]|nr:hypothetical protein [Pelolinea sp.]